jgi:hypothetical protein
MSGPQDPGRRLRQAQDKEDAMSMMQDHPIDMVRAGLADVARGTGQGLLGLAIGLGLIGALWLGSLRPAAAADPMPMPAPVAAFTATAVSQGHLGVAPLRLDGSVLAQTGALATSLSVCRLTFDPSTAAPLPATCAPMPPPLSAALH